MKKFVQEFEATKRELLDAKHLDFDPEWKNLFSWLRENITIDNYVSKSMEENAKNHEFDEEIDYIEEDFPAIFEVRECDLKIAEAQLEVLRKAETEYQKQNVQLRKIVKQVNEDVRELSKESAETYAQSEIWGEKVATLESQLESLTVKKDESMKQLMEMYQNPEKVLAFGHIPMDSLKMKIDIACKRLETCMTTFNTDGSFADGQRLSGRIESVAEDSVEQYEKLLSVQTAVAGVEKAIELMDGFTGCSLTSTEISTQMAEMKKMSEIYEAQIEELTTECILGKKHEIMQKKEGIYIKVHEIKLKRAQNRIGRLQEIDQFAGDFTDIAELLWILLQIDSKRIRNFLCVFGKIDESQIDEFLWKINENPQLASFRITPQKPREYILDANRNVQVMEKFSELRSLEKCLKSLILGPSSTPISMSPKLSLQQHILRNLAAQTDASLTELRNRFVKEYKEPKATNKLWDYRRMLWIWFLTKPQNVLMAIQAAASTPSKKSTMKALPGIRNT